MGAGFRRAAVVASVLAAALIVAALTRGTADPSALRPGAETFGVGSAEVPVGQTQYFGVSSLNPHGDRTIRLTAARPQQVPDGVEVVGVYAVRRRPGDPVPLWYDEPTFRRKFPQALLGDVAGVELDPQSVSGEEAFLLLALRPTKRGEHVVKGLRVTYSVGGRKGTAEYPYEFKIVVPVNGAAANAAG